MIFLFNWVIFRFEVNLQGCISFDFLECLAFIRVDCTDSSQQYFSVLNEHLGRGQTFLLLHINLREEAGRHVGVLSLLHILAHDWFHMIYPRETEGRSL